MPTPLDDAAVAAALTALDGWTHTDDALARRFELGDFRRAMSFLVAVGFEAEQRNHHPELRNVYGTVEVRLTTHDAGNKVTAMDVDLAGAIDAVATRFGGSR